MQPHNECRIHQQVVQIGCYWGVGGHTELYLLQGDTLAIVDTGVFDTPEQYIVPALEIYGLKLSDVDLILNTHGHHDHAGGNHDVVAASGAQVYVHAADVRTVEDPNYQFEHFFAQNDVLVGRTDRLEATRAHILQSAGTPTRVSRALQSDDVLDLGKGLSVRVVHIPGHTPGSVGFWWEREGMIFVGDSVLGMGGRVGGFPLIYDAPSYEESIGKLLALDVPVIGLGHHYRTPSVSRDSLHFAPDSAEFLKASLDCAHGIRDAMARAIRTRPGAGFHETARLATDYVAEWWPVVKGDDGLPNAGNTAALYSYWKVFNPTGDC